MEIKITEKIIFKPFPITIWLYRLTNVIVAVLSINDTIITVVRVSTGFRPIETGSSLVMLIVWVVVLVALTIPCEYFVRINKKLEAESF